MKSYTDLKQSKMLAEFLPLESADMYYSTEGALPKFGVALSISNNIPCWSLAALLSVTRNYCTRFELTLRANKKYNLFVMTDNFVYRSFSEYPDGIDNPIDACYKMILKLHELNLL